MSRFFVFQQVKGESLSVCVSHARGTRKMYSLLLGAELHAYLCLRSPGWLHSTSMEKVGD